MPGPIKIDHVLSSILLRATNGPTSDRWLAEAIRTLDSLEYSGTPVTRCLSAEAKLRYRTCGECALGLDWQAAM